MPTTIGDCPVFIQIEGPSEITRASQVLADQQAGVFRRKDAATDDVGG